MVSTQKLERKQTAYAFISITKGATTDEIAEELNKRYGISDQVTRNILNEMIRENKLSRHQINRPNWTWEYSVNRNVSQDWIDYTNQYELFDSETKKPKKPEPQKSLDQF